MGSIGLDRNEENTAAHDALGMHSAPWSDSDERCHFGLQLLAVGIPNAINASLEKNLTGNIQEFLDFLATLERTSISSYHGTYARGDLREGLVSLQDDPFSLKHGLKRFDTHHLAKDLAGVDVFLTGVLQDFSFQKSEYLDFF